MFLKKRSFSSNYNLLSEEDLLSSKFYSQYNLRYNRLYNVSKSLYYFSMQSVDADLFEIQRYASSEGYSRVITFRSKNLLRDENRLLKVFKLNSFLYFREANFSLAQNLFNPNGYIAFKKVHSILEGKAKFAYSSTFKMIELELDQEIGSNVSKIRYIKEG